MSQVVKQPSHPSKPTFFSHCFSLLHCLFCTPQFGDSICAPLHEAVKDFFFFFFLMKDIASSGTRVAAHTPIEQAQLGACCLPR